MTCFFTHIQIVFARFLRECRNGGEDGMGWRGKAKNVKSVPEQSCEREREVYGQEQQRPGMRLMA